METTVEAPKPLRLVVKLNQESALCGRLVSYGIQDAAREVVLHFEDSEDSPAAAEAECGFRVRMSGGACAHLVPKGYAETPAPGGTLRKVLCDVVPAADAAVPSLDEYLRASYSEPAPAAN